MRARIVIGGSAGLTAVVIWVIALAVFQPAAELNDYAENNSYWARDLRHAAIFLALAGLVLIAEGRVMSSLSGVGMVLGWIAADVFFDRADVGLFAAGLVGLVLFLGFAILAWYLAQLPIVRPDNRNSMFFWSAVCVVLAVALLAILQTPAEFLPRDVAFASATTAIMFLVTACTLAAEASGRVQFGRLIPVALIVCLIAGAVVYHRHVYGEPWSAFLFLPLIFGPLVLGLLAVTWLSGRVPETGALRAGLGFMLLLVAPVLAMVGFAGTLLLSLVIGPPLTALAGSPAVNAADQEFLLTLGSVASGLIISVLLGAFTAKPVPPLGTPVAKLDDDSARVS